MISEIKKDAQERMKKSLDSLDHAFAKIRTRRAHPNILDSVMASYYGAESGAVHPHVRGEMGGLPPGRSIHFGSSPRAWGNVNPCSFWLF
mgnify:CR=1 FL=1